MEVTSYSKFRENMKSYLDNVVNDSRPLYVTRTNGEDVVVLSKSDYESMQETYYLMSSPKNAERLLEAIKDLDEGKGVKRDLIEE
ncbi:MAG: type II toxin-antitoxin system prevent-host-death family antitoxin [Algoriphagus sp.]|jgi:antitoxin YefM|uniref:type II toxin-antitoxin system Phd/YefM family antitoxin n=1 Tax=Algoriphagus sp. TaxID=1872435 RepID=UPI002726A694|nr:type II toxin-antitoxin system prevent-host-death family antitoxin [Algoriphagus sp.]MDO8965977.1 type II toxin-antitoxin system prevent-host-death family antitoxin [Algoriphagus sp.]MDP2041501.1 type II toxin-antitoxin system prevent-host-death family antitoxin [Algoriphagus sp.]MDP3198503.1 type II toxin-antitoxin system prevent-host-death family antitoxin [Algoriphagus sp.]MDP3470520.1 type II toxin-antitoxin system prevent-host-death family antitoxin [Algoriphagus sp.]